MGNTHGLQSNLYIEKFLRILHSTRSREDSRRHWIGLVRYLEIDTVENLELDWGVLHYIKA